MKAAEVHDSRKLIEANLFAEVLLHVLRYPLDLPVRKSAASFAKC